MAQSFNEKEACQVVKRQLEKAIGETCKGERKPDETNEEPPVDLRCTLAGRDYAFEHTGIELYPGQMEDEARNEHLRKKLERKLSGKLPGPGLHTVAWPIGMRLKTKNRRTDDWLDELTDLIVVGARRCHADSSKSKTLGELKLGAPARAPEAKGFWVRSWGAGGPYKQEPAEVEVCPSLPAELRKERKCVVERALETKLPKLERAQRQGAISVLVLESTDIFCDDAVKVVEDIRTAIAAHTPPDQVHLVETRRAADWWIWNVSKGWGDNNPTNYCRETGELRGFRWIA